MTAKKSGSLYWSLFSYENWKLYIAATKQGLCFVGSAYQPYEELVKWANHNFPGIDLIKDDEKLQPFADELTFYFQGKIKCFTIPIFYRGTLLQEAVWKALCDIFIQKRDLLISTTLNMRMYRIKLKFIMEFLPRRMYTTLKRLIKTVNRVKCYME